MSITRFNKNFVHFTFKAGEDFKYYSLKDLYEMNGKDAVYRVNALYINDTGYYGKTPLAVGDEYYINLPSHLVDTVEEIRADEDLVNDINNGKVGFKIYEYYVKKYNKKAYSVNWIELDNERLEDLETPF